MHYTGTRYTVNALVMATRSNVHGSQQICQVGSPSSFLYLKSRDIERGGAFTTPARCEVLHLSLTTLCQPRTTFLQVKLGTVCHIDNVYLQNC